MLPCATVLAVPPDAATYRASGLVLWHFSDLGKCPTWVRKVGDSVAKVTAEKL